MEKKKTLSNLERSYIELELPWRLSELMNYSDKKIIFFKNEVFFSRI